MVAIPAKVVDLMNRPESVKILVTADAAGQPHAIVCGSFFMFDESTVAVGEVMMRVSAKNMSENKRVAILVTSGKEAFEVVATVGERMIDGPALTALNDKMEPMHLHANALWTFDATAVFDESAGPNAGKKIA
ncbi:MAG: pyridoxamine 5'-phosphate oxidase family protein [Candidatus Methanomethylophilaceae archaeon]